MVYISSLENRYWTCARSIVKGVRPSHCFLDFYFKASVGEGYEVRRYLMRVLSGDTGGLVSSVHVAIHVRG